MWKYFDKSQERALTGRPGSGEDYSQVATVPHRPQVEKLPYVLVGARIAEKLLFFKIFYTYSKQVSTEFERKIWNELINNSQVPYTCSLFGFAPRALQLSVFVLKFRYFKFPFNLVIRFNDESHHYPIHPPSRCHYPFVSYVNRPRIQHFHIPTSSAL